MRADFEEVQAALVAEFGYESKGVTIRLRYPVYVPPKSEIQLYVKSHSASLVPLIGSRIKYSEGTEEHLARQKDYSMSIQFQPLGEGYVDGD